MPGAGKGPINERKAVALYADGFSIAEIANKLGASKPGISVVLRRCGVAMRSRGNNTTKRLDAICADIAELKKALEALRREVRGE